MTEDYKEQLLDYITGDLTNTSPTTNEIFVNEINIDRSEWISFIPSWWLNFRYEGMVAGNELTSGLSVLYGGYIDSNGVSKGIITLVDDSFKPIKTIYQFSSGTDLRYIQYMKQAEDGSFYFIDDERFSYEQSSQAITSQKRFVMVNNLTVKPQSSEDYQVNLRTSYIIPDAYKNFYCRNMFKDPNSSHYIFFGSSVDIGTQNYDYRKLSIFGLKINVGSANEWTSYVDQQSLSLFASAYAQFNSNSDVAFKCVYTPASNDDLSIKCVSKTYTGSVGTSTIKTFTGYKPYIDEGFQKKQSVFISIDEVYFVQNNSYWGNTGVIKPKYIGLYKHNFNTNTTDTIFEKYLGDYDYTFQEYMMIDKNVTDIYVEYINDYNLQNATGDYYMQRYNGTWNPILIGENKPFVWDRRSLFVKNNFNLLQVYSYPLNPQPRNWFLNVIKEDYYTLNYNGEPYVNTNVLTPHKARIYSGNNLVFARNLYNVSKQNNMTMSSVEIPNNYLNDTTITQNDLISETNLQMNSDDTQWTKNVYEVVDLNFLNTISVTDVDTNENYLQGAIRINNAITDENDYSDMTCTKARINYTDSTTNVISVVWTDIDELHKETEITLYVDKPIMSIDFISEDEETIYLTKMLEVEVDKYYTIKQKIRIGDE